MARESFRGGGEKRVAAHRNKGKLTVRQRLHELLDEGSFMEIQSFAKGCRSEHLGMALSLGRD